MSRSEILQEVSVYLHHWWKKELLAAGSMSTNEKYEKTQTNR